MKLLNFIAVLAGTFGLFSCVSISGFDKPYMQESFIGLITIAPVIRGLEPASVPSGVVSVLGNKTGKTVIISGLPKNDNFKLLGTLNPDPTVSSGLVAKVINKSTLKVVGFFAMSDAAEDLEVTVTGTLVRQGPQLSTSPKDPIIIKARIKHLIDLIPEDYLNRFVRKSDKKPVSELDRDEFIPIYQIQFTGQVTSVF